MSVWKVEPVDTIASIDLSLLSNNNNNNSSHNSSSTSISNSNTKWIPYNDAVIKISSSSSSSSSPSNKKPSSSNNRKQKKKSSKKKSVNHKIIEKDDNNKDNNKEKDIKDIKDIKDSNKDITITKESKPVHNNNNRNNHTTNNEKKPNRRYNNRSNNHRNNHTHTNNNNNIRLFAINSIAFQIDYYFTISNLLKDIYLRKHMNSEGWVELSFISQFQRIQHFSQGDESLIKEALPHCKNIEYNSDDNTLRTLHNPLNWIL